MGHRKPIVSDLDLTLRIEAPQRYSHYICTLVPMDELLLKAVSDGDLTKLQRLLEENQPTELMIQDLLDSAAGNYNHPIESRVSIIQYILNHYPPTGMPERALRKATFAGSIPLFSVFFTKYDPKSIINVSFEREGAPLVVACTFRKPLAFVEFLLENGADPNYGGEDSEVVLMPLIGIAAMWRDDGADAEAAVDLLLKHGANGIAKGLETAKSRGNEVVERRLLKHGLDGDGNVRPFIRFASTEYES